MRDQWFEKIYAGFLGMDAGMRLGAPVENPWWTYERLRDYFGDIRGYLREYKTHPADDDINGPVIFLRALLDSGGLDFTEAAAGEDAPLTNLPRYRCRAIPAAGALLREEDGEQMRLL